MTTGPAYGRRCGPGRDPAERVASDPASHAPEFALPAFAGGTVRDRDDALPTTLLLDAQGKVVQVRNGGYDEQSLAAAIPQYLGVTV